MGLPEGEGKSLAHLTIPGESVILGNLIVTYFDSMCANKSLNISNA